MHSLLCLISLSYPPLFWVIFICFITYLISHSSSFTISIECTVPSISILDADIMVALSLAAMAENISKRASYSLLIKSQKILFIPKHV
mmetsp:Transcript_824/g.886  ORF Transcript_824/g.886 Transcript_824/m.886 type:complete len:88 (-) Transcript_824:405-668(-)